MCLHFIQLAVSWSKSITEHKEFGDLGLKLYFPWFSLGVTILSSGLWVLVGEGMGPEAPSRSVEVRSSIMGLASHFWKKSVNPFLHPLGLFCSPSLQWGGVEAIQLDPSALCIPRRMRGQLEGQAWCRTLCQWVCSPLTHAPSLSLQDADPLWAMCEQSLAPSFLLSAPHGKRPKISTLLTPLHPVSLPPDSTALHGRLTPFHVKCAEHPPSGPACTNQIHLSLQSFTWAPGPRVRTRGTGGQPGGGGCRTWNLLSG